MSSRVINASDARATLMREVFEPLSADVVSAAAGHPCIPNSQAALGMLFDAFQERYIGLSRGRGAGDADAPPPVDYFRNLTIPQMDSKLHAATEKSSLISPLLHRDVDVMPGINESMYYLAKTGSYCEMHYEDGGLPSLNLLRCLIPNGTPFATTTDGASPPLPAQGAEAEGVADNPQPVERFGKIWLFVHDKNQILNALHDEVRRLLCPLSDTTPKRCVNFNHKDILITRAFLHQYQLPYSLVGQALGDIIFIKSGIFHQVINIDNCFNEAVNFGTPNWNLHADLTHLCRCPQEKISNIAKNTKVLVATRTATIKIYDCPIDGCAAQFCLQKNLDQHMIQVHDHRFSCPVCHQKYRSRQILKRHI
ncbi:unnamed protein product [Ceutorhynchus assimilis]|uniref:JmjC domain-containing protein n=1 Tax=Ceutorhynchus assimilis TaxID=467358 RepID=A0A9N9N0I3_9CUCU|nr:unnamed protein product [Ceutorhynchus assimilis]